MPTDAASLMAWLKDLREAAKLNQKQAGEALSTTDREIRRWENESAPGGVNLLRLLSAYGVTITPPPPEGIPRAVNAEIRALREELETGTRSQSTVEQQTTVDDADVRFLKDAADARFFMHSREAIADGTWDDLGVLTALARPAGLSAEPEFVRLSVHGRYEDLVRWLLLQKAAETLRPPALPAESKPEEQGVAGDSPSPEDPLDLLAGLASAVASSQTTNAAILARLALIEQALQAQEPGAGDPRSADGGI